MENTEFALFCSYQPIVFKFTHWEIKNDNGYLWSITTDMKNKTFIATLNDTSDNNAVAILRNSRIMQTDSGQYICHLQRLVDVPAYTNTFETLSYQLTVYKPMAPHFDNSAVENVHINFTQNHILNCAGNGLPKLTTTWLRNGKSLASTDLHEYWNKTEIQLKRTLSANYTCVIENKYGTASKVFIVKVHGEPTMDNATALYIVLSVLGILVLLLTVVVLFLWRKMNRKVRILGFFPLKVTESNFSLGSNP